ncbi:hypothetical protein BLNAU_3171 [Blattamonas nauphoetae]|uniref:Uncharacterized protein n=1 Tax=Blattamonas nauphoetae TaxID=2049346 RepID=A0ABQ9YDC7_9EUKA|nr:hypothetical protein BLNAU_3171 [Blattamonas nauphoetae]
MNAENDAQALLVLSVHTIRSTPRVDLHLDSNPAAFDRVVEFAGHLHNLPLVAAAIAHIAVTGFHIERKPELNDLLLHTLRVMAARCREGVKEGCAVGMDEVTSQIVGSCLTVLRFLLKIESFDPTPFVDLLVSLVVTTDLSQLQSILLVLQEIEDRTQNTTRPFSISTTTAPFKCIHHSSVTQQPLPSIVASILLSACLKKMQNISERNDSEVASGIIRFRSRFREEQFPSPLLSGLNWKLIARISKKAAKMACHVVEKKRAKFSQTLTHDDPFAVCFDRTDRHATPQRILRMSQAPSDT